MATILLAASPLPGKVVKRILSGHELRDAETIAQAEQLLHEQAFDLILCTILFDESRMFDLLRLAKSKPEWRSVPFVCARVIGDTFRSATVLESAAFTCRALGAEDFLDIATYQIDPEREIRQAIERLLPQNRERLRKWIER